MPSPKNKFKSWTMVMALAAAMALAACGQQSPTAPGAFRADPDLLTPAKGKPNNGGSLQIEYDYLRACQYVSPGSPGHGAINNVCGAPTWVVPGEVAMAALALQAGGYAAEAQLACDYLARVQRSDGSWYNQYSYDTPVDLGRFARMTAQAAMALGRIGGHDQALQRAVAYLKTLQDPALKQGQDDGLICGGYTDAGAVIRDRWTSDNAFALIVFDLAGETAARNQVAAGINQTLAAGDAWQAAVNELGFPVYLPFTWVHFAPAMLNADRFGVVYPAGLADRIATELQVTRGRDRGAVAQEANSTKLMPGMGFQASLAWQELGRSDLADSHTSWAEQTSGLWQVTPDEHGITGGWVDWKDGGSTAQTWERFVDTSAYYLMVKNGWQF